MPRNNSLAAIIVWGTKKVFSRLWILNDGHDHFSFGTVGWRKFVHALGLDVGDAILLEVDCPSDEPGIEFILQFRRFAVVAPPALAAPSPAPAGPSPSPAALGPFFCSCPCSQWLCSRSNYPNGQGGWIVDNYTTFESSNIVNLTDSDNDS
ncbi:hypothetical protein FRX31_034100 [Thalictrum thalictroides]|uniref:TF-B3 domain-containing protein n=1 Tax=Thalictrum thalictroides TaxID=46969 RepID=A0A7J6UUN1_THATH|nr:hypothetical protein FRX31_034100 [Thalictrum thalictroides]